MSWMIGLYALVGASAGLLGGLLGIGGGLIVVPALLMCFSLEGFESNVAIRMALGTSMASIVFTAISSTRAHHSHSGVVWAVVFSIAPGLLVGTFGGSWVAAFLPEAVLRGFFVVFLVFVATQMARGKRPKSTRKLPGKLGLFSFGTGIGLVSSLVGIGGGSMSVPFLIWHNVPVKCAIGTSAALGLPIALAGTVGYIMSGASAAGRPDHCLGYLYLPALFSLVIPSMLLAPVGAKWSHKLPPKVLNTIFAVFLIVVAVRMVASLFEGG